MMAAYNQGKQGQKSKNMLILDRAMEEEFSKTIDMFDLYVSTFLGAKERTKIMGKFDMEREKRIANDVPF